MLDGAQKASEGYTRRDTIAEKIPQKLNRKQHWKKSEVSDLALTSDSKARRQDTTLKVRKIQTVEEQIFF